MMNPKTQTKMIAIDLVVLIASPTPGDVTVLIVECEEKELTAVIGIIFKGFSEYVPGSYSNDGA